MSAESPLAPLVEDRQIAMFAMFVGPGLYTTRAALSAASKIAESTLKNWANGAAMPLHGALTLRKFLPREAVNMIVEPGGVRFAAITTAATNWDNVAAASSGLVSEICEARRDGQIDHVEEARLKSRARALIEELSEVAGTD